MLENPNMTPFIKVICAGWVCLLASGCAFDRLEGPPQPEEAQDAGHMNQPEAVPDVVERPDVEDEAPEPEPKPDPEPECLPSEEVCDGMDNDCDDKIDEGLLNDCGGCGELDTTPGEPCGQCGVLVCEGEDAVVCQGACPVMRLALGAERWEPLEVDFEHEHAPTAPVKAAFDLETLNRAYLLTDETWHVLLLTNGTWIDSGPLATSMPEVAAAGPVRWAYSVPASFVGRLRPTIVVVAGGRVFSYDYQLLANGFQLRESRDEAPWESPLAPGLDEVQAAWFAADHDEPWFGARPGDLCQVDNEPPLRVIQVLMTASHQHVLESEHCLDFIERVDNGEFFPFGLPEAPDRASVQAAFWQRGLYLIKAP